MGGYDPRMTTAIGLATAPAMAVSPFAVDTDAAGPPVSHQVAPSQPARPKKHVLFELPAVSAGGGTATPDGPANGPTTSRLALDRKSTGSMELSASDAGSEIAAEDENSIGPLPDIKPRRRRRRRRSSLVQREQSFENLTDAMAAMTGVPPVVKAPKEPPQAQAQVPAPSTPPHSVRRNVTSYYGNGSSSGGGGNHLMQEAASVAPATPDAGSPHLSKMEAMASSAVRVRCDLFKLLSFFSDHFACQGRISLRNAPIITVYYARRSHPSAS